MSESTNEPLAQAWLRRLKNHPVVATLVVATAVVAGAATLAQSLSTLKSLFGAARPAEQAAAMPAQQGQSEQDREYERALLGTWRASEMPDAPSGIVITDFRYTYLPNGVVNTRGSFKFGFQSYPILLSGTWKVSDGHLEYTIHSSNVETVKEGFKSQIKILSVDDTSFAYVDLAAGETRVDTRAR